MAESGLTELSEELSVSEMTIRRDLDALQKDGLIERVHGGRRPGPIRARRSPASRRRCSGNKGRRLPSPSGPRRWSNLAPRWPCRPAPPRARWPAGCPTCEGLTVVTNSMNVWNELQRPAGRQHGTTVILTGGEFRTPSDALVGPTADASIRSLYFDVLFLGVHGLDPVAGLTTPNISEAETNRTFISRCRRLVVVADHTKWRTTSLCTMANLSDVDTLVTDDGLPDEARRQLRSQVGDVIVAVPRIKRRDPDRRF